MLKQSFRLCLLCGQYINTKYWEEHRTFCEKEFIRARPWLNEEELKDNRLIVKKK
jgi:hypothetical protein